MLSGYYTIASGLLTRQRELNVIGNNLVNTQSAGYRADRLLISSFEQELLTRREGGTGTAVANGASATAAVADETVSLFHPGAIAETGRSCDLALAGEGFFNIAGADGTTYLTRNGAFDLDENGALVLPGVGRVLGTKGVITPGSSSFTVTDTGDVLNASGNYLDTLRITAPADNTALEKLENGMFRFPAGTQTLPAGDTAVLQNRLEQSNVDMNREMTLLIESQRAFQACSSALQIGDALNRKATQIAAV